MNFNAIQKKWYEQLEKDGFRDCEDYTTPGFPLKRWSGFSVSESYLNTLIIIDPENSLKTSFPEPIFNLKEDFMNYTEFKRACEFMCRHGNSTLNERLIIKIWEHHCDGLSVRKIGIIVNVARDKVHRTIKRLTEWMNMMGENTENLPTYEEEPLPEKKTKVVTRSYIHESDAALVYSTWRNNLWYAKELDEKYAPEFYRKANREIRLLLQKPNTKVKIACLLDDPTEIAGYAVFTDKNLEWIYVKISYRNQGIANLLTKGFSSISTPMTPIGVSLAKKKKLKIQGESNERNETETEKVKS